LFLKALPPLCTKRQPLVVNPQGHISDADYESITSQFEQLRGSNFEHGPPMYIISPNDRQDLDADATSKIVSDRKVNKSRQMDSFSIWLPTFTKQTPEWVVLSRATALAARTYEFLHAANVAGESDNWTAIFYESTTSFKSYDVLLRVDTDFVIDTDSSSRDGDLAVRNNQEGKMDSSFTRSLRSRYLGPKPLRRKTYRNLQEQDGDVLVGWRPIDDFVTVLREKLSMAVVFYNELSPDIIAILWRPSCFANHPFSVMLSENVRPITHNNWKMDSLVTTNIQDILRDISQLSKHTVVAIKAIDKQA
jgi:hypothetical protein